MHSQIRWQLPSKVMAGGDAGEIGYSYMWDPHPDRVHVRKPQPSSRIKKKKKKKLEFSPKSELGRVLDQAFSNMNSSFSDAVHILSDLN